MTRTYNDWSQDSHNQMPREMTAGMLDAQPSFSILLQSISWNHGAAAVRLGPLTTVKTTTHRHAQANLVWTISN